MSGVPFVVESLAHATAPVRTEAAAACERLICPETSAALIHAARNEADTSVEQKIAVASEGWPDQPEMGAVMLELFNRTTSAAVRREILFSCTQARWPNRAELLLRAFDVPEDGVLGAAFEAMSVRPEPRALEKTLQVAKVTEDGQPPIIDTLGAFGDPRGMRYLIRWLSKQDNPVVRVKLLLALEKTSNHEADALLLQLLHADNSFMVVEQTIGIISRKQIAGGEDVLAGLAVDKTAPIQLRIEAIWAMGRFDTPEIRKTLDDLDKTPEPLFPPKPPSTNTEGPPTPKRSTWRE